MIKQTKITLFAFVFSLCLLMNSMGQNNQVQAARSIIFPVIGTTSYSNDYTAPRGSGLHYAIDIIAKKRQPLVAAVDGIIVDVQYPEPSWGYSVSIQDADGYRYTYIHMNDDNPGTNDGKGGGMNAYAADVKEGNPVVKGQLIGRVGDSGNSNGVSHLHFEMAKPGGARANPYETLQQATKISSPRNYPSLDNELLPSGTSFKSKVSLDLGNFDLDSDPEIVTGTGVGGSYVKVFETDGTQKARFAPNSTAFKGGSDVAAGNVDGDAQDEIITGAGPGGSYVKVFETDGTQKARFAPYGTNFKGGISVATGDIDGDTIDEIITGAGPGGGPRVSVFEADGTPINTFYAYSTAFKGGIDVAAGDVIDSSIDEIITGAGPGAKPEVGIWQSNGTKIDSYFPYSQDFVGGVRVSVGNVQTGTPKAEILSVPASKGDPIIRMYSGTGSNLGGFHFMEQWWKGYHDIAATEGLSMAATGVNRRDSIRPGIE